MSPLFTAAQRRLLLANGAKFDRDPGFDPPPVVKLFKPDGAAAWLLASLDPADPDVAFGLCDLGLNTLELGSVSMRQIEAIRGPGLGLAVERDRFFVPGKPISAYADDAVSAGRITA